MLNCLGCRSQASTHAAEIDQMIVLVHWLMLVLFVGWGVFFVFVLFRFRKGANPRADYAGAKGKISKGIEVADRRRRDRPAGRSTPFPPGRSASSSFPAENEATVVRVVGEQFAWNIHYPGADGKFGRTDIKLVPPTIRSASIAPIPTRKDDITTINQLNLPVDRPVLVHLSSKDVIHSFGLYEMRVKQDAIPGHAASRSGSSRTASASTRSPARSCAASATSGCAASSPIQSAADLPEVDGRSGQGKSQQRGRRT